MNAGTASKRGYVPAFITLPDTPWYTLIHPRPGDGGCVQYTGAEHGHTSGHADRPGTYTRGRTQGCTQGRAQGW